jgi:DNA-binding transcriptional LysR family regulator
MSRWAVAASNASTFKQLPSADDRSPLRLSPPVVCQYDTRKSAALDLQRLLRQCLSSTLPADQARITQIIDQSRGLLSTDNTSTSRNGALAGAAIALGEEIVPYFGRIIEPVLECFADPDNRIRYFAVECVVRRRSSRRAKAGRSLPRAATQAD